MEPAFVIAGLGHREEMARTRKRAQRRNMVPNVNWRTLPMEDLRGHPQFWELPEIAEDSAVPSDPKMMALLRQDSVQWDLAHRDRLTTRLVGTMLGFYEQAAADALNVPYSMRGHEKAVEAFGKVQSLESAEAPFSNMDIEQTGPSEDFNLWKPTVSEHKFSYEYNPSGADERDPDLRNAPVWKLRVRWGKTQEPISILSAVNYFSGKGAKVREAGLHCLEAHTADISAQYPAVRAVAHYLPKIGASPDGVIEWPDGTLEALEAKNHCPFYFDRKMNRIIVRAHGPFMEVGAWYIAQLMWHMLCIGPDCRAAVLISTGISGVAMHRIQRDDILIELMIKFIGEFCARFVSRDAVPPEDFFTTEDPDYMELLQRTVTAAQTSKLVALIKGDDVQRSPANSDFFL